MQQWSGRWSANVRRKSCSRDPPGTVVRPVIQRHVVQRSSARRHRQHLALVAHVDLLVEHHAELANLLQVAALGGVQSQAVPEQGHIAFG